MFKQQLITQQELLNAIDNGATLLTGNNRLANSFIHKYDQYQLSNNKVAWSSPDILPLNSWLVKNWEEAILQGAITSAEVLLSSEQEQQLWESIIKESPYGNGLLRISATAKSVSDAWKLLQSWKLCRNADDYEYMDDTKAFNFWSYEFEKKCEEQHWITAAQLASQKLYSQLFNYCEILLLGFDELTPQIHHLFESLEKKSCTIKWLTQESNGVCSTRLQCDDIRDEITSFSYWAKYLLESNASTKIALVAPDIKAIRQILLQTLEQVLMPSRTVPVVESIDRQQVSLPWDISLGLPLTEYSIIKLAFQLFKIVRGKPTIETVGVILRSPHIHGALEEKNQRSLLERRLREQGEPLLSLRTIKYYCGDESKNYYCPKLFEIISELIILKKNCLNKSDSQAWALWFSNWLLKAGWGLGRILSSDEYQTIEAWKALLQTFTSLELVSNKMSFDVAISCLHRLASDKIFQVQSKAAPIQILGLYESIGLSFDALWVMNLHDGVWPASPRPNPFIPLHIQKKFKLPHASWERELLIAKQITTRLQNSAKSVVFSYPVKSGAQELHASPLIQQYEMTTKQALDIKATISWASIIREKSKLIELDNEQVAEVGSEKISGGSSIFKNQSLCPFRAFVENRLHARPMRKTQLGLDAMKRGSLLHVVLEKFWKIITDQKTLESKSSKELELTINKCIELAISEMAIKSPDTFTDCFTQIEKQRLLQLMLSWLALELERAPFKVVDIERELNININGVKAQLFIDRVDELENGHQLLIDYKTGLVTPNDWFGERPADPQLPLYSVASGENLSAVIFAQLKTGDVKFNGVVEQAELIPDLPPSRKSVLKEATEQWPQVLHDWKLVLNSLATDFVNGHIAVDPKEGLVTCKKLYCELSPMCRINELLVKNNSSKGDFNE